jgi:predicted TIM-barrel fold metal-dependent hydrolase
MEAQNNHVTRMCVIQPSSYYGWDNRYVCDLALAEPEQTAGICTLNPEDASSPARVRELAEEFGIRGIRCIPSTDGHIHHAGVRKLWQACAEQSLPVNVFIRHGLTNELERLLDGFPSVDCVIDHCLLLSTGEDEEVILESILALAQYPHAHAKLSFLPMGSKQEYPYADLHEACYRVIDAFTPARCMWGSNFPCELWTPGSTYSQNLQLFTSELGLSPEVQQEILWNTPNRLWFDRHA